MSSPTLPWDVLYQIPFYAPDLDTLHSLSLTCKVFDQAISLQNDKAILGAIENQIGPMLWPYALRHEHTISGREPTRVHEMVKHILHTYRHVVKKADSLPAENSLERVFLMQAYYTYLTMNRRIGDPDYGPAFVPRFPLPEWNPEKNGDLLEGLSRMAILEQRFLDAGENIARSDQLDQYTLMVAGKWWDDSRE